MLFLRVSEPGDGELDRVAAIAKTAFGIDGDREPDWRDADLKRPTLDLLQITIAPSATKALEEIADHVAKNSGASADFSSAFGALFYLHKDDAFIDTRLMDFFQGHYGGQGVARGLMMQIAATRHS